MSFSHEDPSLFILGSEAGGVFKCSMTARAPPLTSRCLIGLIHDGHHVGFQNIMQISHVLCYVANIRKQANCGKPARGNIEMTLLKVYFRI